MVKYHQGKYKPKNVHKIIGDPTKLIYRSSWEKKLAIKLDHNSSVKQWGMECLAIPYISPIDNLPHRYFIDFVVDAVKKDGTVVRTLIEVKPYKEQFPPVKGRNKTVYLKALKTYMVNQAKWKYARSLCAKKNWRFVVCTEKDLYHTLGKHK